MPRFSSRRPDDHHHSLGEKSDGLKTRFAVVLACVLHCKVNPAKTMAASVKSNPRALSAAWRFVGSKVISTI
jgi:hypothetical protein